MFELFNKGKKKFEDAVENFVSEQMPQGRGRQPSDLQLAWYEEANKAVEKIGAFRTLLCMENDKRPQKLRFFFPKTKANKLSKLEALIADIAAIFVIKHTADLTDVDYNNYKRLINTALQDRDLRVSLLRKCRTKNLLQNILDGRPGRGILKPLKLGSLNDTTEWRRPNTTKRWW